MKRWILISAVIPALLMADAVTDRFTTDDYLFVKAQIIGCGPQMRFVEVGQVMNTGKVTLFEDIVIETEGKTAAEITDQLVDSLEKLTGHRSKTIEIMKVSAEEAKKATYLMMRIYTERSRGCEFKSRQNDAPDWQGKFQIARRSSHTKRSSTFRPSASTGRGSTAPLNQDVMWRLVVPCQIDCFSPTAAGQCDKKETTGCTFFNDNHR